MQISLKPGERIFINGAVLRVDRKVTFELMNDATFLLESHVIQAEDATTPLRQLYFIVQTMLMDPSSVEGVMPVFVKTHALLMAAFENEEILFGLRLAGEQVSVRKPFDAMKTIRGLYAIEAGILAGDSEKLKDLYNRREVA